MSMGKGRASSKHTPAGKAVKHGGGYGSLKVREKREATRERPRVRAANVSAVSDWGAHRGSHSTDRGDAPFKNERLYDAGPSFQPVPLGNTLVTNVGKGGPGAGRTLYGQAGTQCMTGKPAQGVPNTAPDVPATTCGPDIHSMYGPERTIKR
jgi:hypothetical protein